jgi:hypothetical protein
MTAVTTLVSMPQLRLLITGLSLQRSWFTPGSLHVGFVVDKVALGYVFLRVFQFSSVHHS